MSTKLQLNKNWIPVSNPPSEEEIGTCPKYSCSKFLCLVYGINKSLQPIILTYYPHVDRWYDGVKMYKPLYWQSIEIYK